MNNHAHILARAIIKDDLPTAREAFAAAMKQKTEKLLTREYQNVAKTFVTPEQK